MAGNFLAKDIGGLPVGVWAVVVIGGVAVGWFLLRPKTTAAPATTGTPGATYGPPGPPGDIGPPGIPGPPGPIGPPSPNPEPQPAQYTTTSSDSKNPDTLGGLVRYFGGSIARLVDMNVAKYPIIATYAATPEAPLPGGWILRVI